MTDRPNGDRRVQRTRETLREALLDLIVEKGYGAITVQDLIDRANVGRSTFYSHYEDKEALLLDNIERLRAFLLEQAGPCGPDREAGERFRFRFSLAFLQHVRGYKQVYRATVDKPGGERVLHPIRRLIRDLAQEEMAGRLPSDARDARSPLPREIAVSFVVDTLFGLLAWWMQQRQPCSAEEADRLFHRLALRGLSAGSR